MALLKRKKILHLTLKWKNINRPKCDCFDLRQNDKSGRKIHERPFEPHAFLESSHHDASRCQNRKILEKLENVREKCFEQKCPDGTWLYMAPARVSTKSSKTNFSSEFFNFFRQFSHGHPIWRDFELGNVSNWWGGRFEFWYCRQIRMRRCLQF